MIRSCFRFMQSGWPVSSLVLWICFVQTLAVGRLPAAEKQSKVANWPGAIQLTLVDQPVIHYATFQSHNMKVVELDGQIFMTHLRTRNEAYTQQAWRLSRSLDGGTSFQTVAEDTAATNPPVLEVSQLGELYMIRVDFVSGDAFLDRWLVAEPKSDATLVGTTRIPGGAAGKYAALIDQPRGLLYFFSHNNSFHRLRLDGSLLDSRTLLKDGPNAALQYPHLSLTSDGILQLAWTTVKHREYLYWDIHHLYSTDGADTFRTWPIDPSKPNVPLSIPIVADDTGPAHRVSLDDEFQVHTWLASSMSTAKHWHALYLAQTQPPRQHYMRYSLSTGKRELDQHPKVAGQQIQITGLDGFFVADPDDSQTLYMVGSDQGRLACLVSRDAGSSWHDYARAEQPMSMYSIGGYRWTTSQGAIIGSFTDQKTSEDVSLPQSSVYFFRIDRTKD
jgi:hypothetical protein